VDGWIRISIEVKIQELSRLKMDPRTLKMKAWRLKIEVFRVSRPVVADSHHLDEEEGPDPDPH
jgi:hypothetical protein